MTRLILILILLLIPSLVAAACVWEWDCSQGYPCRQVPVCDNSLDLPPLKPLGLSPIPPPALPPITAPVLPPIGTTQCRQVYTCNNAGRCGYQTLCQ